MRLVFWQNMLSFHQETHIVALVQQCGCEVVWVAEREVEADRTLLAWNPENVPGLTVVITPTPAQIDEILSEHPAESVHIFSGLRGFPLVAAVIKKAHKLKLNCAILQERRPVGGFKGLLREGLFRLDRIRYGKSVKCVLVMGYSGARGGAKYFESVGYPKDRLYPYGYFSKRPETQPKPPAEGDFKIIFVGSYIKRKGVDTVLRALSQLIDLDWSFEIIGDGEMRNEWVNLGVELHISDRLTFPSFMPNAEAMERVAESDLLILPSRFDGWGFVVNEALMRGVPAFCSDLCGASDLLQEAWRGAVFPAEDSAVLALLLRETINLGKAKPEARKRIYDWAACIDGRETAGYLLAAIKHSLGEGERPTALWLNLPHLLAHAKGGGVSEADGGG